MRALIVATEQGWLAVVRAVLGSGDDVLYCATVEDALATGRAPSADVIVVEYRTDPPTDVAALVFRAPILCLLVDPADAAGALRAGATDCATVRDAVALGVRLQVLGERTAERLAKREGELRKCAAALQEARHLEALGRLAGGVAHDFNNLLMVIESCSEALTETLLEAVGPSHPVDEEIVDMEGAVTRAKQLVRQLMSFGRRVEVESEALDLEDGMRPMIALVRRLIGEDIELVTYFEPGLPAVLADPSQLEQVVVNLLVNARDAIRNVGVIQLSVKRSPHAGFVEISVRDDGEGMDEDVRSRIFEPYFTTKEPGKGTGLGLATVHGIVSAFGGRIEASSERGAGTELRVHLPMTSTIPKRPASGQVRRVTPQGAGCVMLVEDEPGLRRAMARALRRRGYEVLESQDGTAALDHAEWYGRKIDLLVTDVIMPRLGGEELARRLRDRWPELNVIFMSGHAMRSAVGDVATAGVGPLLSKPFDPAKLLDAVRAALEPAGD